MIVTDTNSTHQRDARREPDAADREQRREAAEHHGKPELPTDSGGGHSEQDQELVHVGHRAAERAGRDAPAADDKCDAGEIGAGGPSPLAT